MAEKTNGNCTVRVQIKKVLNFLLILAMLVTVLPFSNLKKVRAEDDIRAWLESKKPLYAGYYRTWHDVSSVGTDGQSNGGKVEMDKIPSEVDLVFMFDDWQATDSPYYEKLKTEYVPNMHAKGQKVVRTIGTEYLNGKKGLSLDTDKYKNDEEGYKLLAKDIVEEYVYKLGLDGLDIDIERHNYNEAEAGMALQNTMAEGVLREIAKLIGPNGDDKSKLLIIDTTMIAETGILKQNYDNIDLLLVQRYGTDGEAGNPYYATRPDLDGMWDGFSKYISAGKLMIGFSFYEERSPKDNRWYDIPFQDGTSFDAKNQNRSGNGIKDSRAGRYALWQPKNGGLKGGIFSYAIERDGVYHPYKENENVDNNPEIDVKLPTTFEQSKELKRIMLDAQGDMITEADFADAALRESIIKQVGRFKGDLERFDGELKLSDSAIKDTTGLSALKKVKKIIFDGLTDLEILDIKSCSLETLDITSYENYRKLKKIDISGNKLDLSVDSPDRKILDKLMENNLSANVEYGEQEPVSYPDYALEKLPETLDKADEAFDLNTVLTVTKTIRGTDIEKLADLMIKEKDVIKSGYMLTPWNYTGYTFKVIKHDQTFSTESKINRNEDASYKVIVFDADGKKITEKMVKVGNGEEFLENLSYKAKVLWQSKPCNDNDGKNSIDYLFDDNLNNERPQIFASDSRVIKFVVDIGKDAEVKKLEFYNEKTVSANSIEFAAVKDKNVSVSDLNAEYCNNDANFDKIKEFELNGTDDKYSEKINLSESRYWRITFNGTPMGVMAHEIKLLGTRKNTEPPKPQDPKEPQNPPLPPVAPYIPSAPSETENKDIKKEEPKKDKTDKKETEIEDTDTETPKGEATVKKSVFTKNKLSYKIVDEILNIVKMSKPDKVSGKLTVPASVTYDDKKFNIEEIEKRAFKGEKRLKAVSFGKNVKKIGKECFADCANLKLIEFKGNKIKYIGKSAFKGINAKVKIKVPAEMSKKDRVKLKKMLIKAGLSKDIIIE